MKSSIELLESRKLLSAATIDYSGLVDDERALSLSFRTASQQETVIRSAINVDLRRLKLPNAVHAILVALSRHEAADISQLNRNLSQFEHAINSDAHTLIARGAAGQQHSTNRSTQNAFSLSLAKFEQDEVSYQKLLLNDASNASTGTAATELASLAAADPSDITLQSDAQSGVSNLQLLTTTVGDSFNVIGGVSGSIISDSSGIEIYGDEDFFSQGYPAKTNPYQSTLLTSLAPNAYNVSISKYVAPATFTPSIGDYPGTDQIYVGSNVTPGADQIAGPQVITLDYSALTKLAHPIKTFTLGIATDGFENPTINIPYTVSINGVVNAQLTSILNNLDDADRVEQFVSIGIDPATLLGSKVLTISIDSPGNDISGWAVDFLTVGIQNG